MYEPILYESHCHTPLCKHAVGAPGEYAAIAEIRGLKGIIVTCHSPLPDRYSPDVRMAPEQYETYVMMVAEAREAWLGRVDVRLGLESDYYPGVEPWLKELHARVPLHHVLGSVHPHLKYYRKLFYPGTAFGYEEIYYEHLAQSAETGLYDTLAHPDLIKNEDPATWDFSRIRPFIERSLDRIAATGVAMELNTGAFNRPLPKTYPGLDQLKLMQERDIPVVLGADAHEPKRVASYYPEALRLLQDAGYESVSFFLDRQRQDIPIPTALASLRVS